MSKYDIKILLESYSEFEEWMRNRYGDNDYELVSQPWAMDYRGISAHLGRISDPDFNSSLDPSNIPNPDTQLDYEEMLDSQFVEFFRNKQGLRRHWVDRVYNNKDPNIAAYRTQFWKEDVLTFHNVDYGSPEGDIVPKFRSYFNRQGGQPQLSCKGYAKTVSSARQRALMSGRITFHVVGTPVFAYNGDAWSEFLSTAGPKASEEMPNGLVKTPRTTIRPTGILFTKKDVERSGTPVIGEIFVADWTINAIILKDSLSQDIINHVKIIADEQNIPVIIIERGINFSDL